MLYLSFNTQQLPLSNGRQFSVAKLPGLAPATADGPVAVVSANPNNPSVLGLKNLSTTSWQAVLPSGFVKQIEPERTIKLEAGTKIILGSYAAEVIDNALRSGLSHQPSFSATRSVMPRFEDSQREISTLDTDSSKNSQGLDSSRRLLPLILAFSFIAGLVFFAISYKSPSSLDAGSSDDSSRSSDTETPRPTEGVADDGESYRPLSLDTSSSSSSAEWGSSAYSFKDGVSPGDQYPVSCAFAVTDESGEVVTKKSKVEYWACRIEPATSDNFYPVAWSDGKSTSYKFYANKTGKVIGTNGEVASFKWFNSSHKGVNTVVIKHGSEAQTWIPATVSE